MYHGEYQLTRYQKRSGLVLGFHGTDQSTADQVVMHIESLKASRNAWDWLGHGIYFWEHSPLRALEFARTASKRKGSIVKQPAVVGAVLDLGNCLDLLDYGNLQMLKNIYEQLSEDNPLLPDNRPGQHEIAADLLLRRRDCFVIEKLHEANRLNNTPPFDSVRAVFFEGPPLYPNAGFREKNHIQICIRNPDCIKGLFIPKV